MSANRQYKSSLFTTLFSDQGRLLSLYNAVSGGELPPDTPIRIATLDDVLFMKRRNDVAFKPCSRKTLLKIPRPDFYVLYNGTDPCPDEDLLRLSDAFNELPEGSAKLGGSLELEVKVLNVNMGRNEAIVKKSEELHGYTLFVGKVRANEKTNMGLTAAVTKAVKDCIDEGILADFLRKHGMEVVSMLNMEWRLDEALAVREREDREEGLKKGGQDMAVKLAKKMLLKGSTAEEVSELTELPLHIVKKLQLQSAH